MNKEIEAGKICFEAKWINKEGKAKGSVVCFTSEFFDQAMKPGFIVNNRIGDMVALSLAGFLDMEEVDAKAMLKEREDNNAN